MRFRLGLGLEGQDRGESMDGELGNQHDDWGLPRSHRIGLGLGLGL